MVLAEPLPPVKLAGLAFLLYGASLLKREGNWVGSVKALVRDRACQYMAAASLLIAVGRLVDKTLIAEAPPRWYACLLYFAISGWVFLFLVVKGRVGAVVSLFREKPGLSIVSGAINGYSYLCLLFALKSIDVSVAEPASMLGMIITLLLSKVILKETLGSRLLGAAIMVAGAWILLG